MTTSFTQSFLVYELQARQQWSVQKSHVRGYMPRYAVHCLAYQLCHIEGVMAGYLHCRSNHSALRQTHATYAACRLQSSWEDSLGFGIVPLSDGPLHSSLGATQESHYRDCVSAATPPPLPAVSELRDRFALSDSMAEILLW